MFLTQQADYAVRAVLELAGLQPDERLFSRHLAAQAAIPQAFLTKILARLAAAGIVSTKRGLNGGARLKRPAGTITLLEIIEAVDGPIALNRCTVSPSECPRDSFCPVHGVWCVLQNELRDRLANIDFAMLARGEDVFTMLAAANQPSWQEKTSL